MFALVCYIHSCRIQKLKRFVKSIIKPTRSDLARVVVPEVFRFEEMDKIFSR